jgi:type IX secretion system PorP/SprF family membrane protein
MKKLLLIFAFFTASLSPLFAQQDALFSQYMFNMMLVNPAYTGSRDVISLSALYRNQWANAPGAPQTMTFSADAPLKREKMGIGLTVFNDKIGVVNNSGFYATYSYRIRLTNNSTLALGANVGGTYYTARLSSVDYTDDNTYDPAFASNVSKFMPNIGLGIYYSTDKLYIGLSSPHLLNNQLDNSSGTTARQYRHYFLMGGYLFKLNHALKLRPSVLVKQVYGAPIQADLNCNLWFYDKFAVGLSYRSLDAPMILLEAQILEQLRFGYAFEYTVNSFSKYASHYGTHELMLRYEFGYDKGKVLTPRYF